MMILSGDPPRGRALRVLLIVVVAALALAPFLFPGAKALNVAEKICVMALLAASYDLLLGYTGIVSFAHVMFFGIGAYGVAIALYGLGPGWGALALGARGGAASSSLALALAIGLFSLRVQSIFFAMVTLAVAYAFNVLASQLSWLTGGEDGRSFQVPAVLRPGFRLFDETSRRRGHRPHAELLSRVRRLRGRCSSCCCASSIRRSGGCCRRSARTRSAPRRSATASCSTARSRPASRRPARRLAGALSALWLHYVGPDTALSFSIQIDVLVIVVIGGMGSIYGAIVGAALFVLAENYLQALMGELSRPPPAGAGLPILPGLFHPDRWLLWLGLMFILAVYFAPTGIVGALKPVEGKAR